MNGRRAELGILLAVLAVALVVRLGDATRHDGYTWDSGLYFTRMARQFGAIHRGEGDSQFGAARPVYPPAGYPLLVRATHEVTGLSFRDAAQAVVLLSGLALVPLAWALTRRFSSATAALAAAALVAMDGALVASSTSDSTELPFCALSLLALILVLPERPSVARLAAAGTIVGLSTWVRTAGLASSGALLLIVAWRWRRGEVDRRGLVAAIVTTTITCALVAADLLYVERAAGATPYAKAVMAITLFDLGRFPDAYFTDSTGATLRLVSSEKDLWSVLGPAVIASIWARGLGGAAVAVGLPGLLAALAPWTIPAGRRVDLGLVLLYGLGFLLLTVFACAPPEAMGRYVTPARPVLAVLACVACAGLWRRAGGGPVPLAVPTLLALALGAALWPPRGLPDLLGYGRGQTARELSDRFAAELSRTLPVEARVARGPGGSTQLVTLAGGLIVQLPSGPDPAAIERYVRLNRIEWVAAGAHPVHQAALQAILPNHELTVVHVHAWFEAPQALVRVRDRAPPSGQ